MKVIRPIIVVILVVIAISFSGCTETKETNGKLSENTNIGSTSNQNLKVGDTAVLSLGNAKLAVTVKYAKKIPNPTQNGQYEVRDIDYSDYDGITPNGENLIGVKVEIKNIGDTGITTDCVPWYANIVDYAGFSYHTLDYGALSPYGMYPGDMKEATLKFRNIPDKALDGNGMKFEFACGKDSSWVIFPK